MNIGKYSSDSIQDITFSDSNTLLVSYLDTSILLHNWVIDFDGNVHNPLVGKLLAYDNTTINQLKQLKPLLQKINCSHFDKDENLIRVRYAGHWGESFDYIIPITNTVNKGSLNNLSDNYYWEHRLSELFCGLTDW